jgi:inosine-uridine nucleoside N-ribohydrolase
VRLWIDTDVGTNPDDAFALLCASAHPEVELVGVSTVDGDTEWRAAIARLLVPAPVVPGARLGRADVDAAGADALLAIGPQTNIARLVSSGFRPPRLAVMGGALAPVRHRGAVREVEHNFGSDHDAARTVLRDAPAVLLCPLDVTARMRLSPEDLDQVRSIAPQAYAWCEDWIARQRAAGVPDDEAVVCLHDPLALVALLGEPVVTIERMRVVVEHNGHASRRDDGRACDVVVDVDVAAAITRVLGLIARAELPAQ